jgi:hypothetical protein
MRAFAPWTGQAPPLIRSRLECWRQSLRSAVQHRVASKARSQCSGARVSSRSTTMRTGRHLGRNTQPRSVDRSERRGMSFGNRAEGVIRRRVATGDAFWAQARPLSWSGMATSRSILIIDDNEDAAASLGMLLNSLGAEVLVAYSGQQGLDRFGEGVWTLCCSTSACLAWMVMKWGAPSACVRRGAKRRS